jgi:PAS domain S-box-containing protein
MDIVDEFGTILFISENMKSHLDSDVLAQKCWMAYRDDQKQCPNCPLLKGIQIGETGYYESEGVLGGKTFQISHTGMWFQGKKAILEIFQDITDKKEIEKKLKLLAHSLESISECVSVTDDNDIIIYVNKSFVDTYGYTENELIGQHTSILRPADFDFEHVRDILPRTLDGGWRGEIINRKKDGTLFPILLSTSVIKNGSGKPVALVGAAIDITEMRKSREELMAAKEKAEESNRLKSAFLNNMSHEIRTPMNHIIGFSSLMAEAKGEEKDTYADIVLNSSNQLLILIENVIFLSRLQSEKTEIKKEKFSPYVLINSIRNMFDHDYLTNKSVLSVQVPEEYKHLSILSDEDKIKQILTRLTSNATKYTFEGTVELGFEMLNGRIRFFVKDSGIGIPLHEQQKIFDSFYRSEQAISMVIGGTGLGLSIVKELVTTLNGKLEIESEPGKGSCFSFTIPIERANELQNTERRTLSAYKPMEEVTILVADDEPVNFLYLEILLKNKIKRLDHAHNGKEAVEMAANNRYKMILVDLKMPEMDGFEAAKRIRQNLQSIPIIAQTAYATTEDREKAIQAGCDDLIAKPIKKDILIEMIQKYA